MTQHIQSDARAQPAPAQLPKTLRELAEVVHDWGKRDQAWAHPDPDCFDVALFGHISEDGEPYPVAEVNADTYGHEGVSLQLAQFYAAASPAAVLALLDRVELRDNELKAARAETMHWRSNHDNVVARLRISTQRPDIPKELADRIPWYRELVRLQEVEAQAAAKCQHQGAAPAPVTYMATDNACKWAWDQVREDVGTEGWSTSESCNFYGFFMWGWIYRGQNETQRPAAPPAPAVVAVQPAALESSILDLEAWEDRSDGEPMTLSETESVSLVLQELKRLRALAAAPAQAWPSECDSPELCQVHRGCAGQYGTKDTCPSFAALNPCNSAARAKAVAVPTEVELPDVEDMAHSAVQEALSFGVNHDVFHRWMRAVMDKTVQALAAAPAQEHATQLAGQGQECGVCGSDEAYTGTCGGGRKNPRALCFEAAPAQAQEDAREADMFWVADDPEQSHDTLHDAVVRAFEDGGIQSDGSVEIQRAVSMANIVVRITSDRPFAFEILPDEAIDAARAAQGGA